MKPSMQPFYTYGMKPSEVLASLDSERYESLEAYISRLPVVLATLIKYREMVTDDPNADEAIKVIEGLMS